jgi:hypothetical protein
VIEGSSCRIAKVRRRALLNQFSGLRSVFAIRRLAVSSFSGARVPHAGPAMEKNFMGTVQNGLGIAAFQQRLIDCT